MARASSGGHGSCLYSGDTEYYDREESHGGFIVITQPPNPALCGGVSILSWNDAGASKSSALSATVTTFNLSLGSVTAGWAIMQAGGIPILGSAFVKAYNPSASAGVSGNYGAVFPHSY